MRAPVFAAAAVLTIAVGIGLNTAAFCLIYATLLEPLPFRDPSRLVYISETHPDFPIMQVGALDFKDWRASAKSFEQMAAYTFRAVNKWTLNGEGETEMVQVTQASHEPFPMLG